ncbi:MAG: hypothetical protein KDI82_02570 [Gammaproteobacteria bacterium]|nr:hypothetical protein [Gammaproteobacteria bacterium]
MRIRRMTLRLPARLRGTAEQDARRIAQAVAEQLHGDQPGQLRVEVKTAGASGHGLAQAVGRQVAPLNRGRS